MSHIRPAARVFVAMTAALLVAPSAPVGAQQINPALLSARWTAQWIRPAGIAPKAYGVYHFRKTFDVPQPPARFVVHVTADNRYELFVNGTRVADGPSRGDLDHWQFETVDIGPQLRAGRNVIAAVVWNAAEHAPMAQVSYETGFLLQGDTQAEAAANTDRSWTATIDPAITPLPIDRKAIFYQYYAAGAGEQVDASRYPWGWQQPDYDASAWSEVEAITIGSPRGIRDTPARWFLVPRTIPPMETRVDRFARVARAEGSAPPSGFTGGSAPWTIPAGGSAHVLLDRGELTTAYPEVIVSGGRGASISLVYTEALLTPTADGRRGAKGNRNEVQGKAASGLRDRFLPDGGRDRLFRPLWWRTYRYVDVEIQGGTEPLVVSDLRGAFSAYPFEQKARFASSDPTLSQIWDVGWRTARLCAHETYMDTPYWEQLQYIGDTRIQALISLYVGGDDRLVRNAIELYDESRMPDGLTQSRYPTMLPQIIPPFSLFWIGMMHDLYAWGGDSAFLKRYLHGAGAVLDWFADRRASSGLLGRLEWWNFADWVNGHGFKDGEPPTDSKGDSAILSLQFVLALREAADLEAAFGTADTAARYRTIADDVAQAVKRLAWDEQKGLFADTPSHQTYSQHVNALAVLADLVPAGEQAALMRRVLGDASLTQATYYFRFYVFRALAHAGLADVYLDQLGPWRQMLALGLTTWAETPDPTRSDSHAWSAHPNYDLLVTVAGVQPAAPGFARVRVAPHLGSLTSLDASVPTPRGNVRVSYKKTGAALDAEITLPDGVDGTFEWHGRSEPLRPGVQRVRVE